MMTNYENYDPCFPDQPVIDLYLPIWSRLPAFRSKPAFTWVEDHSSNREPKWSTSTLTYTQLNDSVQTISTNLLAKFTKGDTIVILCPPGLELVEVIFGCQRAGLLCIPIFPPDPAFNKDKYHHLIQVLSQTKPKAAVVHNNYVISIHRYITNSKNERLAKMLRNLTCVSTTAIKQACPVSNASDDFLRYNGHEPDDVYLVQYTSGATGIPKPVLVTAGAAVHNVRVARKAYDLNPSSVIVSWLPQYHDCGLQFLLLTIVSGATCVLASPIAFVNRPKLWLDLISEFRGTCTPVPSFTLPLVVKRGQVNKVDNHTKSIDLSSLINLILINEPIYKHSVDEFVLMFKSFGLNPSSISPSYGLAENCTFVSTSWIHITPGNILNFPDYKKLLPSARLNSSEQDSEDMDIVVVNEHTHEAVEDGIEGEIWVSSPSNCAGYLGHPSLTHQIFQARSSNRIGRCYVRTGDNGIVLPGEERYLYITGRCSDVLKLHGGREVHPHYIETAAYNSCPRLLRAGCIAAVEFGSHVAIVAEMQKSEKDTSLLRNICEGIKSLVLKEEGVLVGLVVLVKSATVPKTTSGKIQRWLAKDKLIKGEMSVLIEVRFDCNNGYCKHFSLLSNL